MSVVNSQGKINNNINSLFAYHNKQTAYFIYLKPFFLIFFTSNGIIICAERD